MAVTSQRRRWQLFPDADQLYGAAASDLLDQAARAMATKGRFRLVLPGGRTAVALSRALLRSGPSLAGWEVYLSDERCLAPGHDERNSRLIESHLLNGLGAVGARFNAIASELGPNAAAQAYCETLAEVDQFDLVVLGVGEDAHTASLFPDQSWGEDEDSPAVLAVRGAPKWPAERVSLSARRLGLSERVVFIACGPEKAAAIAAWHGGARVPVAAVAPAHGVDILVTGDCAEAIQLSGGEDVVAML